MAVRYGCKILCKVRTLIREFTEENYLYKVIRRNVIHHNMVVNDEYTDTYGYVFLKVETTIALLHIHNTPSPPYSMGRVE